MPLRAPTLRPDAPARQPARLAAAPPSGDAAAPPAGQMVLVLDDDQAILTGLERLLTTHGYRVRLYAEPEPFWRDGLPTEPACLLLDNQLGQNITGVQVHAEMQRRGWHLPTVFVTAHWNIPTVVKVMRDGADGFLVKPYDPAELVLAVAQALTHATAVFQQDLLTANTRARATTLTARERQIVNLVVAGFLNK